MHHHDSWTSVGGRFGGRVLCWFVFAVVACWARQGQAQWMTQVSELKAGWNSVYLHVDASPTDLNSLINALDPIEEVWMWTFDLPPSLSVAVPPNPISGSQWIRWTKIEGTNSALKTLPGNAALLVKVTASVPTFTWRVKGRPVPPRYRWTLTGLNFVGFPTASPNPNFETFLAPDAQALDWKSSATAEIFRYAGGTLGSTNPLQVAGALQRSATFGTVTREQAYWIRTGEPTNQIHNQYFGPFQIAGADPAGLRFGDSQGQTRLYLKNMTRSNLTVTLREVASEAPPAGPTPSLLPLMVRGAINTSNLTFNYSSLLAASSQWTLAASGLTGSEVEILLGVDRAQMGAVAGIPFAGVLRFTDSLGLTRVDIGASATTASRAGLWVGNAVVEQVSQYLKRYAKSTNAAGFHAVLNQKNLTLGINNPTGTNVLRWAVSQDGRLRYEWDPVSSLILVFGTNAAGKKISGSYLQDGPILTNLTGVARPVPLRLIVHNNGTTAKLMQRAYLGRDGSSNQVVATKQSGLLAADLAGARRLSAVHLPISDVTTSSTNPWLFTGAMQEGSQLVTTVSLGFNDQASNPFLHTYHPDHDNLDNRDDTFQTLLTSGQESYEIRRVISLSFTSPGADFDSRTRGGTGLMGNYAEAVSILGANNTVLKNFNVLGTFGLTRITDSVTLVSPQ